MEVMETMSDLFARNHREASDRLKLLQDQMEAHSGTADWTDFYSQYCRLIGESDAWLKASIIAAAMEIPR